MLLYRVLCGLVQVKLHVIFAYLDELLLLHFLKLQLKVFRCIIVDYILLDLFLLLLEVVLEDVKHGFLSLLECFSSHGRCIERLDHTDRVANVEILNGCESRCFREGI